MLFSNIAPNFTFEYLNGTLGFSFQSPTADLNVSLTFCVRSLLNRCISLHPPQTVLGLYQEAFKISAAETKEGSEIDGPFDYVIATFRYDFSPLMNLPVPSSIIIYYNHYYHYSLLVHNKPWNNPYLLSY